MMCPCHLEKFETEQHAILWFETTLLHRSALPALAGNSFQNNNTWIVPLEALLFLLLSKASSLQETLTHTRWVEVKLLKSLPSFLCLSFVNMLPPSYDFNSFAFQRRERACCQTKVSSLCKHVHCIEHDGHIKWDLLSYYAYTHTHSQSVESVFVL